MYIPLLSALAAASAAGFAESSPLVASASSFLFGLHSVSVTIPSARLSNPAA